MQYKIYILLILFLLSIVSVSAQGVSFIIDAPGTAEIGSNIQLKYTVKNGKGDDFQLTGNVKGFDILYGPAISHQSSTSVVNGEKITESSIAYSYMLQPKKAGVFTFPVASIIINGKKYVSNSSQIEIFPSGKESESGQSVSSSGDKRKKVPSASDKEVFLRLITSKTTVSDDKPVEVTCRLYTLYTVNGFENFKSPAFEGFTKEVVELPKQQKFELERYNGRNYSVVDILKCNLYPERHGDIIISPLSIDILLGLPTGEKDAFFDTMKEVKKTLKTEPVTIKVLTGATLVPKKTTPSTGNSDRVKKKLSTKKKKAVH